MTKKLESAAHIAMGFVAGLLNLGLLLHLREWRQLPPANNEYPVLHIAKPEGDEERTHPKARFGSPGCIFLIPYWSKVRTLDTLRDLWEYQLGQTVSWFLVLWAGIEIGRRLVG